MTTMKPCPRCHSTEHLHINIVDDFLTDTLSAKAGCTECHVFSQRHYVFNDMTDDERPSHVQLTKDVIFSRSSCSGASPWTLSLTLPSRRLR